MPSTETRSGGNATGLPAPVRLPSMSSALSRRAALFGAVTVAGVSAAAIVPAQANTPALPRSAQPMADAALIQLAGRVEALAARLRLVENRCGAIEDRVMVAHWNCPRPPLPPEPEFGHVIEECKTATERTITIRQPLVTSQAHKEWRHLRDAAKAAENSDRAAMEARHGLPGLERRRDRMWRRLGRWTQQLAEMDAATAAGLSAKARAFMALGGGWRYGIDGGDAEHLKLGLSILAAVSAETGDSHG